MSLIHEVIEAKSLVTIGSLLNELPHLVEESESLNKATMTYIDDVYVKFNRARPVDYFHESQKLIAKAEKVRERVQEVIETQVDATKNEVSKCQVLLKNVEENLELCYPISHYHDTVQRVQKCIETKNYVEAVQLINEINVIDQSKHAKIMDVLVIEALHKKNDLISLLEKLVNENITTTSTSTTFTLKFIRNEQMQELLSALYQLEKKKLTPLDTLSKFLSEMICNVLPNNGTVDVSENMLVLKLKPEKCGNPSEFDFRAICTNLIVLSKFVFDNLAFTITPELHAIDYIRHQCDDIENMLIKHYLERSTPTTDAQLARYDEIKVHVDKLQTALIGFKLLPANCIALTDYASEIATHYADKKCQTYRTQADALIKKDLSHTEIVGTECNPDGMICDGFAQCAISCSVLELLDLVKEIFGKARACCDGSGGYYATTAASVLDSYHDQVDVYHQRLLLTIPKQTAIFYNNCKYIAHHINTPEWQKMIRQVNNALADFVGIDSITQRLNDAAEEMLAKYIHEQVAAIKMQVKDIRINPTSEKLDEELEKKIRQCLRHMELLKTMWQKVLNYFDYNSNIGLLLNALSGDVIEEILRIDDIPIDVVDQLVDILKVILTRGPKLFTEPKEIRMYVPSWDKLSELLFVLTSRLVFIADRWADGKGPLALHFSGDEMRKLIRALFQNSDLRADVLKRIH